MNDFTKKAIFFSLVAFIMLFVSFVVYIDVTRETMTLSIAQQDGWGIGSRTIDVNIGDTVALSQRGEWFVSFHGTVYAGQPVEFEYGELYWLFKLGFEDSQGRLMIIFR